MTRLGGVEDMSCMVLELYLMDVCLSGFSSVYPGERLSLSVIHAFATSLKLRVSK